LTSFAFDILKLLTAILDILPTAPQTSGALEYKFKVRYLITISSIVVAVSFLIRHLQRASSKKTIVTQQKPDDFTCSVVFKRINNNQFQHTDLERKPRLFANFYKNEY
jgi:hypothetical protein